MEKFLLVFGFEAYVCLCNLDRQIGIKELNKPKIFVQIILMIYFEYKQQAKVKTERIQNEEMGERRATKGKQQQQQRRQYQNVTQSIFGFYSQMINKKNGILYPHLERFIVNLVKVKKKEIIFLTRPNHEHKTNGKQS